MDDYEMEGEGTWNEDQPSNGALNESQDEPLDETLDEPLDGTLNDPSNDLSNEPLNEFSNDPSSDTPRGRGRGRKFGQSRGGPRRDNFGYGRGYDGPPPFGPFGYYPNDFGPGPMGPGPMGPMGPYGPGPAPYMWGRGFGPGGPSHRKPADNKAFRYLLRCGVPKENIRNLPRAMLRLMEPEYCGLCGHNFDSFALSRIHYLSKNHTKNQKKWLAQQSDVGYQRPKEMPMKSRELYCELCDVQITSKSHAESHYAGKSHRSIVQGNKNPKNPMLLQSGMQERMKQLIRREKKHLKIVEDAEEDKDELTDMKDGKPYPPELYCEICKTTVTCTEQMTMHLNGKKHLNKEKQHILRMMKSGGTEEAEVEVKQETDDVEEESAVKDGEDDVELVEEAEEPVIEVQDDWENGDGNWDEPAAETNTAT